MFIFYDLIFLIFGIVYLPFLIFRGKLHREFHARLGILHPQENLDKPIWVHAVSVGEAMAMRGLIGALRKKYPTKKFAISTVTPTGNRIAKTIAKEDDFVFYLPLDLSFAVKRVINTLDPALFIVAETEIWPNLISFMSQAKIPIVVVNGRISDASFKGYRLISFLLKPILNRVTLFCMQTQIDAQRLARLGVSDNKIKITGNMKFDIADHIDNDSDYAEYRQKLGLSLEDQLFIAGSTHPGEEVIIIETYKELVNEFPSFKLLIAPRHPERVKEIEKVISKYAFASTRVSQLNGQINNHKDKQTVLILDTVGQLVSLYEIADIVFVGGSLVKTGGHNILEPACFEKPILVGPHTFNFRDIISSFLHDRAILLIKDKQELKEGISGLLKNKNRAEQLGKKARELILKNQGSTDANISQITSIWREDG